MAECMHTYAYSHAHASTGSRQACMHTHISHTHARMIEHMMILHAMLHMLLSIPAQHACMCIRHACMHVYPTCMHALHTHVTTHRHMHAQRYPTDTCMVTRITYPLHEPHAPYRNKYAHTHATMWMHAQHTHTHTHTHVHAFKHACTHTHTHALTHTHSLTLPHTCLHLLRARHAYLPAYVGCMHFRSRTRMPSHEMFVHMHVRTGARTHLCAHVNVRKG
jgi:hypothetical protein